MLITIALLPYFDHIPAILNEPIFKKAFNTAELSNLTYAQLTAYEKNKLDYLGIRAAIVTAKNEGLAEGSAKGKAELLKHLLTRRFGQLPDWAINKIDTADTTQLEIWAESIFDANDIDSLFRW